MKCNFSKTSFVRNSCFICVNSILNGGLHSSTWTELVGEPSTGKTQMCLSAALSTARENSSCVAYVDTSGSFSAERLTEMHINSNEFDINSLVCQNELSAILTRIRCFKIFDPSSLMDFLNDLIKNMEKQQTAYHKLLKLIVIDNLGTIISPILSNLPYGHYNMMYISRMIRYLATTFDIAILTTNFTISGGKPALGKSWSHVSGVQIILEDPTEIIKQATLMKSPHLPIKQKAKFTISSKGIIDCEDITQNTPASQASQPSQASQQASQS